MIGSLWFNSFSAGGGGAAADYELISTTVLGSSAASVTFSGLGTSAAAYKHLQIRWTARSTKSSQDDFRIQMNGDTANHVGHVLYGSGISVGAGYYPSTSAMYCGIAGGSSDTSGIFGSGVIDILDFASTKNKTMRALTGVNGASKYVEFYSGAWLSTSAITSFLFASDGANSFVTGSRFSLYGLKA